MDYLVCHEVEYSGRKDSIFAGFDSLCWEEGGKSGREESQGLTLTLASTCLVRMFELLVL